MADQSGGICAIARQCEQCCSEFYPKRTDRLRFCSRECAFKKIREKGILSPNFVRAEKPWPRSAVWAPVCRTCSRPFISRAPNSKDCPSCRLTRYLRPKSERRCIDCGTAVVGTAALKRCLKCNRRRSKQMFRTSGGKAASRKARKCRLRGVATEVVNPLYVLGRDSWCCQLCGVKTPKSLRGSLNDRAPEVDHIVPIARGGEHSYRNTQCACRKCNLAKADRPKGQMRLFG